MQKRKKRWGKKFEDKRNWKEYNEQLIRRGEFYINPTFLETWDEEIEELNKGKVGQPYKYPNSMIAFLAVLRSKGFDYRALEGIIRILSEKLGPFPVICYSQIRRRILKLPMHFESEARSNIVSCDGSGIKVSNRGEWMREKWKVRRGWIKVVIMGDINGNIVDIRIGDEELDEKKASREMIEENKDIDCVILDGLHDSDTFDLCKELGIVPAIKIRKNASSKGFSKRAEEVRLYKKLGYKEWAKHKGYGMRWVASEGIFSAVKRIFGENVRSYKVENAYKEARMKFWAYQQLRNLAEL